MPTFLRSEMRQKDRLIAMESLSKMLNGYLTNPFGPGSQLTSLIVLS